MIKTILKVLNISLYVVVAKDAQVTMFKECKVYLSMTKAMAEFRRLQEVYGAAHVALFSRAIL